MTARVLDRAGADRFARTMRVLADPSRLQLLSHLAAAPDGLHVAELVERLGRLSEPTVTHHLRALHSAGFADRERERNTVRYRLAPDRLRDVAEVLGRFR